MLGVKQGCGFHCVTAFPCPASCWRKCPTSSTRSPGVDWMLANIMGLLTPEDPFHRVLSATAALQAPGTSSWYRRERLDWRSKTVTFVCEIANSQTSRLGGQGK